MEETFESIDRDTNEKVYYFIAFGLVAIHVVSYYYFLAFELIFAIFKTLTFSADDLNEMGEGILKYAFGYYHLWSRWHGNSKLYLWFF